MILFTLTFCFIREVCFLRADFFMNLVCGDLNFMVILRCEKCGPGYFGQPDIVGITLSLLLLGSESVLCDFFT